MRDPLRNIAVGEEADAISWRDNQITDLRARVAELEKALGDVCALAENPNAWNWGICRDEWRALLKKGKDEPPGSPQNGRC